MNRKIFIAGGVIILLLGVLLLNMVDRGGSGESMTIELNKEFKLQRGQAASFGNFTIELMGYTYEKDRLGGWPVSVEIKISSRAGAASWLKIERDRGVGSTVLYEPVPRAGTGDIPVGEGKHHLFIMKYIGARPDEAGPNFIRLSLLDFKTMEREEYERWRDEQEDYILHQ